jgi:hypothetical protein
MKIPVFSFWDRIRRISPDSGLFRGPYGPTDA